MTFQRFSLRARLGSAARLLLATDLPIEAWPSGAGSPTAVTSTGPSRSSTPALPAPTGSAGGRGEGEEATRSPDQRRRQPVHVLSMAV